MATDVFSLQEVCRPTEGGTKVVLLRRHLFHCSGWRCSMFLSVYRENSSTRTRWESFQWWRLLFLSCICPLTLIIDFVHLIFGLLIFKLSKAYFFLNIKIPRSLLSIKLKMPFSALQLYFSTHSLFQFILQFISDTKILRYPCPFYVTICNYSVSFCIV